MTPAADEPLSLDEAYELMVLSTGKTEDELYANPLTTPTRNTDEPEKKMSDEKSTTRPDLESTSTRASAATPGPWLIDPNEQGFMTEAGKMFIAAPYHELEISEADAVFIAHAREDIPALLAAIDGVLKLHKAVGFDIDDDGTLDPDNDCCDYCSEREGEAVIYPCETVRSMEVK